MAAGVVGVDRCLVRMTVAKACQVSNAILTQSPCLFMRF